MFDFNFNDSGSIDFTFVCNIPIYLYIIKCVLEVTAFFITYYTIAKYVLLNKMWRGKKAFITYSIAFILSLGLDIVFEHYGNILIAFFFFIFIIIGNKKFKFFYLYEAIPLVALSESLVQPLITTPNVIFPTSDLFSMAMHEIGVYSFGIVLHLGFVLIFRSWRKRYDQELDTKRLAKWELMMLLIVGLILLVFLVALKLSGNKTFVVTSDDATLVNSYFISFACSGFALDIITIIIVAVSNKQFFYQRKVLDMQSNIITMMAEIIENRDENTGGHIQRTAKYVEIIANQLKNDGLFKNILTDEYIADMKVAAPLHDIGKIHVSDLILNKPGRLDDEEFAIMKSHAAEGRKLLEKARERLGDFNYLDIAMDMAGSHHEWWDGNPRGYPQHLKGAQIPLCARIMAVADVFDALTSKRCYRDAMQLEKAYKIIREERGTHFDEAIVDAFFAAQEQVEEALNKFQEE